MDTKIVSTSPAATEILCALGLEGHLAGRSDDCNFPQNIQNLPVCNSKLSPSGINETLKGENIPFNYDNQFAGQSVNWELVKDLAPEIIITEFKIEKQKATQNTPDNFLDEQRIVNAEIISINTSSIAGILDAVKTIAQVFDVLEKGNQLIEEIQERVDIIRHKLKYTENKPQVCCINGLHPAIFSTGRISELVGIAGGLPIPVILDEYTAECKFEDLLLLDPDILILMPFGYTIDQTLKEMNSFINHEEFVNLSAVRNNRFYIIDGNKSFNKPGPSIVDSIEILAEIINPKQFNFGFEGVDWVKFTF